MGRESTGSIRVAWRPTSSISPASHLSYRGRASSGSAGSDIYAQRVERLGYLGYPSPEITTIVDSPGDQGGKAVVSWDASRLDAFPNTVIQRYTVWRRIESSASAAARASAAEANANLERALAAGLEAPFVERLASAGWSYVDEVEAFYIDEYAYEAPTFGDSTAGGTPLTGFQVIAHGTSQFDFWTSDPASGYSVDNLAPSAPITLAGAAQGNDVELHWQPGGAYADFKQYAVYRSSSPGVVPGPGTFVAFSPDTTYLDTGPGMGSHFYVVTAIDVHDNESNKSNEAVIGLATGIGGTPALPKVFTVLPNHPNPFTRETAIGYGLPSASDVAVEVYDVAGRRVFTDRLPGVSAGWHAYRFPATGAGGRRLAAGVYFYRMTSAGRSETRKMVIMR